MVQEMNGLLLHCLTKVGVDVRKSLWVWTMLVEHIKVQPLQTKTFGDRSRPGVFQHALDGSLQDLFLRKGSFFNLTEQWIVRESVPQKRSQLGRQLLIVNSLWGAG